MGPQDEPPAGQPDPFAGWRYGAPELPAEPAAADHDGRRRAAPRFARTPLAEGCRDRRRRRARRPRRRARAHAGRRWRPARVADAGHAGGLRHRVRARLQGCDEHRRDGRRPAGVVQRPGLVQHRCAAAGFDDRACPRRHLDQRARRRPGPLHAAAGCRRRGIGTDALGQGQAGSADRRVGVQPLDDRTRRPLAGPGLAAQRRSGDGRGQRDRPRRRDDALSRRDRPQPLPLGGAAAPPRGWPSTPPRCSNA